MKLVTFVHDGKEAAGILSEEEMIQEFPVSFTGGAS